MFFDIGAVYPKLTLLYITPLTFYHSIGLLQ